MLDYEVWRDPAYVPKLRAYAIDPRNVDVVRCEIDRLQQTGSITWGYDSDTRVSASISVLDPDFPDGSWIRLVVEAPGYSEEIGTFIVSHIKREEVGDNSVLVQYELQSILWVLSEDRGGYHYCVGAGVKTQDAAARVVSEICGKKYRWLPGCRNTSSGSATVYEMGDSFLHILYDLCDKANNRLDCDGHGRVTMGAYTKPSSREPDVAIDERDSRSIVIDSGLTEDDSTGEAYNRTVVHYKGRPEGSDNDVEITAISGAPASSAVAAGKRGITRTQVHEVNDMSPVSQARANQLLNDYIDDDRDRNITRDRTIMWVPISGGSVIKWTDMRGNTSKCLARTIEGHFDSWTMKLTMKRVDL